MKDCTHCDHYRYTSRGKWCYLLTLRADSSAFVLDPKPEMCEVGDYEEKRDVSWRQRRDF